MSFDLPGYLASKKEAVEKALERFLPPEQEVPGIIHAAMRYSVFAGGKRIRPVLLIAAAESVGGNEADVLPAAAALEMLHTYSLIHDDLPAMDDDDYRRGKLTNHKVYGEAMAILAGDALLTHSFEVLAGSGNGLDPDRVVHAVSELSHAAGTFGMVGGQVVDILSEGAPVDGATLDYIHRNKTGALFKAAVRIGGILAGASEAQLRALSEYAGHLGLAFQITDDVLDVAGDGKKLGKPTGSDARNEKATFPSLYGLEKAREMAAAESARAVERLQDFGSEAEPLRQIALFLAKREG